MQQVGYLVIDDFQVMVFAGITVFELANHCLPEPRYDVRMISEAGGPVRSDAGPELARLVARRLVVHHRRAGGQMQHSVSLDLDAKTDRIQGVLAFARGHLASPLTVEKLADVAHLSPRQFSRAFREETGELPAKAIERLRLEAARLMIEDGRHPIDTIATETGFADRDRMRRAFLRLHGQPPQALRRQARAQAKA